MCTVKTAYRINQNFMITNLVLSKKEPFTCEDIMKEIDACSVDVNKKLVEKTLERLRDNDYLEKTGYSYRVIPLEESIRWGGHYIKWGNQSL